MYDILFIHSFFELFSHLAIININTTNMYIQVFVRVYVLISGGVYLTGEMLSYMVASCLTLEKVPDVFQSR